MSKVLKAAANEVEGTHVAASDRVPGPMALPDSPIEGYRTGACLDLRVRFAMDLLTHSHVFNGAWEGVMPDHAQTISRFALDMATELFDLAQQRGLVQDFDDPDIISRLSGHVRRQVAFQLEVQKEGKRQQEEGDRIQRSVARAFQPGKHNG